MGWLVALIVIGAVIWGMVNYPRFRVVMLVLLGLFGLLVFYLIEENQRQSEQYSRQYAAERRAEQQEAQRQRTAIAPGELEIANASLAHQYADQWSLTAEIANRSTKYAVQAISLQLSLFDCPTSVVSEACRQVGQQGVSQNIDIPPGQVRALRAQVFFQDTPPFKGEIVWNYRLIEIVAK